MEREICGVNKSLQGEFINLKGGFIKRLKLLEKKRKLEDNNYEEIKFDCEDEEEERKVEKDYKRFDNENSSDYFEKPIYSKNLTDKEAKRIESYIKRIAYKYWYSNEHIKGMMEPEDVRSEIILNLLRKATEPDKYGNLRIAPDMKNLIVWIKNSVKDINRMAKTKTKGTDLYFNMHRQDSEQADKVQVDVDLYRKSEAGRNSVMENDSEYCIEVDDFLDKVLNEENYKKMGLKPRQISNINKFVSVRGYHSGLATKKLLNLYKPYEEALDEEKEELIAKCETFKKNGNITADVMLKTYFDVKTGIDAGSAWNYTHGIPNTIYNMLKEFYPEYLKNIKFEA